MLKPSQVATIQSLMAKIRGDRTTDITIRRGNDELPAQAVRIERVHMGRVMDSERGSERRADVVVHGAVDLDIQVEDRFTDGGVLYRVIFIRPNRSVATFAEAAAVQ